MDIAGSLGKMEDKEKTLLPWRMEEKEEALLPLRMQALGLSDREQVDGGLEEPKMQEGAGAASTEGANSPRGEMGSEEAYVGGDSGTPSNAATDSQGETFHTPTAAVREAAVREVSSLACATSACTLRPALWGFA